MRLKSATHIQIRSHQNLTWPPLRHIANREGKRGENKRVHRTSVRMGCGADPMHVVRLDHSALKAMRQRRFSTGARIGISAKAPDQEGGSLMWSA